MPQVIRKNIKGKPFFYLTQRVRIGRKYKKIQVYLGKRVPSDLRTYYARLREKELLLAEEIAAGQRLPDTRISLQEYADVERSRIMWNYHLHSHSPSKQEQLWRQFAINFIFESNAIEGSRLSNKEVEAIVRRRYVKKSLSRRDVREVTNALEAFASVHRGRFRLTERGIISLHAALTRGLGIARGYKQKEIVVNNKETTPPGRVRAEISVLVTWWKAQRKDAHPFFLALAFHQRFERIHPFEDGNGRVGRMILIWMLLKERYGVILFRNRNRRTYFSALGDADDGRPRAWFRYCIAAYKQTMRQILLW